MEAVAHLRNNPTSTRKMRLVADLIRGKKVYEALTILKFSKQEASTKLEKLLKSAINNWEQKNAEGKKVDCTNLVKGKSCLFFCNPTPYATNDARGNMEQRFNSVSFFL